MFSNPTASDHRSYSSSGHPAVWVPSTACPALSRSLRCHLRRKQLAVAQVEGRGPTLKVVRVLALSDTARWGGPAMPVESQPPPRSTSNFFQKHPMNSIHKALLPLCVFSFQSPLCQHLPFSGSGFLARNNSMLIPFTSPTPDAASVSCMKTMMPKDLHFARLEKGDEDEGTDRFPPRRPPVFQLLKWGLMMSVACSSERQT